MVRPIARLVVLAEEQRREVAPVELAVGRQRRAGERGERRQHLAIYYITLHDMALYCGRTMIGSTSRRGGVGVKMYICQGGISEAALEPIMCGASVRQARVRWEGGVRACVSQPLHAS